MIYSGKHAPAIPHGLEECLLVQEVIADLLMVEQQLLMVLIHFTRTEDIVHQWVQVVGIFRYY